MKLWFNFYSNNLNINFEDLIACLARLEFAMTINSELKPICHGVAKCHKTFNKHILERIN